MKKSYLFLLASAVLALSACGDTTSNTTTGTNTDETTQTTQDNTSSSSSNDTTTSNPVTYRVMVNAATGVTAHVDKEYAEPGEIVTLTIDEVKPGYSINQVLLNSKTVLTSSDGINYPFEMPDGSASISFSVSVEGSITLIGDVVAALTLNEDTGIYEAKGVKVETSSAALFSYQVKGEGDEVTILDSQAVDETKCFANITYHHGSGSNDLNLELATGCTYDFFYDPSSDRPCYVKRVSVDTLPSDESSLYSLFDGNIRSETTVQTPNLTSFTYSVKEPTASPAKLMTSTMQKYDGNRTFMKVEDTLQSKSYYVYKELDEENDILSVVDTFTPSNGNNDLTRETSRGEVGYSVKYQVVDKNEDDTTRFELTRREANLFNISTPHQMTSIEEEFMYAYRVGYTMDEVSSYDVNISSSKTDTGFATTLNSYIEFDSNASQFTEEMHEANVYDVKFEFSEAGELTKLTYTETLYNKESWDFVNHTPAVGAVGTLVKQINASYVYDGEVKTGEIEGFNKENYFIDEFNDISFNNPETGKTSSDGNYLYYNDDVALVTTDPSIAADYVSVSYTPSTALDLWQYAPTHSTNTSVIDKLPNDLYTEMSCVGIGSSDVTFTNKTTDSASYTITINVTFNSNDTFHGFSLNGTTNSNVTTSTSANIAAGSVEEFDVIITPPSFPPIYNAVSEDPDLLEVVSTGRKLVLSAENAAEITETKIVRVKITSDYFYSSEGVTLTFTIIPSNLSLAGTWTTEDADYPNSSVVFTDNPYSGSTSLSEPKTGTITDVYNGITWEFDFYYQFEAGKISAQIYDQRVSTNDDEDLYPMDALNLVMEYNASTDTLNVYLSFYEMAEGSFEAIEYGIIGIVYEEGYYIGIDFTRN